MHLSWVWFYTDDYKFAFGERKTLCWFQESEPFQITTLVKIEKHEKCVCEELPFLDLWTKIMPEEERWEMQGPCFWWVLNSKEQNVYRTQLTAWGQRRNYLQKQLKSCTTYRWCYQAVNELSLKVVCKVYGRRQYVNKVWCTQWPCHGHLHFY